MLQMFFLSFLLIFSGCATKELPSYSLEDSCSPQSLKFLLNPRFRGRTFLNHQFLQSKISKSRDEMQECYNDLRERMGDIEFNTCFIAGFDSQGSRDIFHFSSKSPSVDEAFISCGSKIMDRLMASMSSRDVVVVHTYQFYQGQ
jgi:hypothetical protein